MKVTSHLIKFITDQMQSFGIERKADLSRISKISEPTIGRILAGKRKTISDPVAEKICSTFHISMNDLVRITLGKPNSNQHTVYEEPDVTYRVKSMSERVQRLCAWIDTEASEETRAAIFAVAKAGGVTNDDSNSSHSGREASRSSAGAA